MEIPERPRLAWLAAFHEASLTPSGLRSLASLLRYFALVTHDVSLPQFVDTHHPSNCVMNEVSMSPKKQKRQRRKFTPEFKAEAVRIVLTSGKSVHAVAGELDLTETCLRSWVQQA